MYAFQSASGWSSAGCSIAFSYTARARAVSSHCASSSAKRAHAAQLVGAASSHLA